MSRKMYEIQFRITSAPEGQTPDPRMINIGLEGINIIDAIMALETVLPEGTEVDIYSAKLEQLMRVTEKGTIAGEEPEEANLDVISFEDKKEELTND